MKMGGVKVLGVSPKLTKRGCGSSTEKGRKRKDKRTMAQSQIICRPDFSSTKLWFWQIREMAGVVPLLWNGGRGFGGEKTQEWEKRVENELAT